MLIMITSSLLPNIFYIYSLICICVWQQLGTLPPNGEGHFDYDRTRRWDPPVRRCKLPPNWLGDGHALCNVSKQGEGLGLPGVV